MKKILAVILVLFVFPACAMQQRKVEKGLDSAGAPNCATAEGDQGGILDDGQGAEHTGLSHIPSLPRAIHRGLM